MKHRWKTDDQGKALPTDEDSEHPVAECITCGTLSGCLEAQEPGRRSCWMDGPNLDADDCEGVNLTARIYVTIDHPGSAARADDRQRIRRTVALDLAAILDAQLDLVSVELDNAVTDVITQWRAQRDQYRADWKRATGLCPSTGPADTEEGATTR